MAAEPPKPEPPAETPKLKLVPPKKAKKPARHGQEVHRLFGRLCKGYKACHGRNPDRISGQKWRGRLDLLLDDYDELTIGEALVHWYGVPRPDYGFGLLESRFRGNAGKLPEVKARSGPGRGGGRHFVPEANPAPKDRPNVHDFSDWTPEKEVAS